MKAFAVFYYFVKCLDLGNFDKNANVDNNAPKA